MASALLWAKELKRHFSTPKGLVRAVDGVSFEANAGETFGIIGESGSGKSTVAYTVLGIYPPSGGELRFDEADIALPLSKRSKRLKRDIQVVFQDPGASLNPRRTVKRILELPLQVHGIGNRRSRGGTVAELLQMVELTPEYMYKVASTLSGGEKARVAIARALATNPRLVVLDEPTSALDVSIQAKIVAMLLRFQQEMNLTYVFISHDLVLMRNVASRIAIMYMGEICEVASAEAFFERPTHPYTQMLLSAIPVVSEEEEALRPVKVEPRGEVPSPVNLPPGCRFSARCPYVRELCTERRPDMVERDEGHGVRCVVAREVR